MVIIIYTVEEVKNSKEPETVIKIIEKEIKREPPSKICLVAFLFFMFIKN